MYFHCFPFRFFHFTKCHFFIFWCFVRFPLSGGTKTGSGEKTWTNGIFLWICGGESKKKGQQFEKSSDFSPKWKILENCWMHEQIKNLDNFKNCLFLSSSKWCLEFATTPTSLLLLSSMEWSLLETWRMSCHISSLVYEYRKATQVWSS